MLYTTRSILYIHILYIHDTRYTYTARYIPTIPTGDATILVKVSSRIAPRDPVPIICSSSTRTNPNLFSVRVSRQWATMPFAFSIVAMKTVRLREAEEGNSDGGVEDDAAASCSGGGGFNGVRPLLPAKISTLKPRRSWMALVLVLAAAVDAFVTTNNIRRTTVAGITATYWTGRCTHARTHADADADADAHT